MLSSEIFCWWLNLIVILISHECLEKSLKITRKPLMEDVSKNICVCRPTGQKRSLWKRNLHCRRSARLPWWPSQLRASSRPLTSLYSLHPFHFLSRDVRTLSTGSETAWRNLRDTQSATNVSAMLVCLCPWQQVQDCVSWSVRRDT